MITPEQAEHIKSELKRRRELLKLRLSTLKERKQRAKAKRKSDNQESKKIGKTVSQVGTKVSTRRANTPTKTQIDGTVRVARKMGISEETLRELGLIKEQI